MILRDANWSRISFKKIDKLKYTYVHDVNLKEVTFSLLCNSDIIKTEFVFFAIYYLADYTILKTLLYIYCFSFLLAQYLNIISVCLYIFRIRL